MNELVPRAEIGDSISNAEVLMQTTTYNDSRVLNFTTCIEIQEESDVLIGVQITLWSEVYREATVLPPIGTITDSSCRTLTLENGGIEFMRASFDQTQMRVNALRYDKNGTKIEYGELGENGYTDWAFTEEAPLLGLYGRT